MSNFTDSLRGYAHRIHLRDNFKCRYCGLDGTASFDKWGGECFVFSSEIEYRPVFIPDEKELNDFEINTEALYDMGGRYIFSALKINNFEALNLRFLKFYTDPNTPLSIYLYEVLPPAAA